MALSDIKIGGSVVTDDHGSRGCLTMNGRDIVNTNCAHCAGNAESHPRRNSSLLAYTTENGMIALCFHSVNCLKDYTANLKGEVRWFS